MKRFRRGLRGDDQVSSTIHDATKRYGRYPVALGRVAIRIVRHHLGGNHEHTRDCRDPFLGCDVLAMHVVAVVQGDSFSDWCLRRGWITPRRRRLPGTMLTGIDRPSSELARGPYACPVAVPLVFRLPSACEAHSENMFRRGRRFRRNFARFAVGSVTPNGALVMFSAPLTSRSPSESEQSTRGVDGMTPDINPESVIYNFYSCPDAAWPRTAERLKVYPQVNLPAAHSLGPTRESQAFPQVVLP